MTNKQVAEAFVNGQNGRSKNMFSEGNVVYSYGYHWPIAIRKNGNIYLNISKYSVTTSRHTYLVRCALTAVKREVIEKNINALKALIKED